MRSGCCLETSHGNIVYAMSVPCILVHGPIEVIIERSRFRRSVHRTKGVIAVTNQCLRDAGIAAAINSM